MLPPHQSSIKAAAVLARFLDQRAARQTPLFVALDGPSGAGKSTVSQLAAEILRSNWSVVVIEGDQFYAGGSAATWDKKSAAEKAMTAMDWKRERTLLQQLRANGTASWYPFDWESDDWDAEPTPLAATPITTDSGDIVLLEGAYTARPELADVVDLRILLTADSAARRQRIKKREGGYYEVDWNRRWSAAEKYYFGHIVPEPTFDLVLRS